MNFYFVLTYVLLQVRKKTGRKVEKAFFCLKTSSEKERKIDRQKERHKERGAKKAGAKLFLTFVNVDLST